jgi:predicted enzyme related to lactoylglutathione lyase
MPINATVHPTLPGVDLERAKKFYEGKLDLKCMNN